MLSLVGRQQEEIHIWKKVSYLQRNTQNMSLCLLKEGNRPGWAAFDEAGGK
jgi:hypothetical protein